MRIFACFFLFFVTFPFMTMAQQVVFGPLFGPQIWDFDNPDYIGFGPDGTNFGGMIGLKDGPTTLEGSVKYGSWKNDFSYENIPFHLAVTDLMLSGGIRREIWFPQVHGRIGLSMHQLKGLLNDSDVADSDFALDILQNVNGRRVAGYFGVGVNVDLSPNRTSFVFDFVIHKFPGDTLYDIETGLSFFF